MRRIYLIVLPLFLLTSLACGLSGLGGVAQSVASTTLPQLQTAVSTGISPQTGGSLNIVPFTSSASQDQNLNDLVSNYQGLTTPGTQTWQVQVSASQAVILPLGMCALDQNTLTTNLQHATWSVEWDGNSVPIDSLTIAPAANNSTTPPLYCGGEEGVIQSWPSGQHTLKTTLHVDQTINAGMQSFTPGDYVDIFQITVTP